MFGFSEEGGDDNSGIWGALGTALIGSIASGVGQKQTNETNIQLGREQMGFQREMSSTAYQRAVKDMAAAGINPMLVSQVGGASSPSGSMPQVQNTIGAAVNGAQAGAQIIKEAQAVKQSQAATEQMDASAEKMRSETMDKNINTAYRLAETDRAKKDAALKAMQEMTEAQREAIARAEREGKQAQLGENLIAGKYKADAEKSVNEARLTENEIKRSEAESKFWDSDIGKSMPYLRSIIEIIRGMSSAGRMSR